MSGKKVKIQARVEGPTLEEVFNDFIIAKKAQGLSPQTIKTYTGQMYGIRRFLDLDLPIGILTDKTFDSMFARMSDTNLSRNSIKAYSAMLMSFFSWCRKEGISDIKITLFKGEETVPEIYTQQELRVLLQKPSKRYGTFAEFRTWCIINLLVNNGIRAATVREIRICDVHLEDSVIILRHTKTRKTYAIPLSDELIIVLKEYMKIRKGSDKDYLFCNVAGEQMSDSCLRSAIREYNLSRGVEKTGIHAFRHTFARLYLVECGGDALKLQKLLGHSTLKMTQHYVQIYASDLVKDFKVSSPLSKVKK